jgi:ectoine hydroxylase-related dioxygenase (phytanoyl-CoA dioxygenase family)
MKSPKSVLPGNDNNIISSDSSALKENDASSRGTSSKAARPTPLSKEQIKFFHDRGYLVVDDLIPHDDIQPVMDELTSEIDNHASKLVARGRLSRSYAEEGFETRLAKISQETDQVAIAIWNGILHGPGIFHLITQPRLLDAAEQLCGPELIASSVYRLRPKIPNYGYGAVPWHQDSGYFEPYCDNFLVLTAWVPLVDATEENGTMWVIAGSHRKPVLNHKMHVSAKYLEIEEKDLPPGERVCCPVRKGGVLFITNRTVHASFINRTRIVRWSMDLRYQSAKLPTNASISRLPDEAVPSPALGVPAACYPPERDFLVRSQARRDEIIQSYEEFCHLRENPLNQPVTNRFNATWAAPKPVEI